MIIIPPSCWQGNESLKWLIALVFASLGHWGLVLAFGEKTHPTPEPLAMPAVMLEFADFPQSATQVESFSIGVMQQITQDSVATPADPTPDIAPEPKVYVAESPEVEQPDIVVEKKPEEPPQKKPEVVKETNQVVKQKPKITRKKNQAKPSNVDSQATAQANSAPPKGEEATTAAPNDSDGNTQQLAQRWQSRVLGKLRRHQSYPAFALNNRIEGAVVVHIQIDARGKVLSVSIHKSSGHRVLDSEALTIVNRASPLPAPPAHLPQQGELRFNLPIRFNLKEYRQRQSR